MKVFPPSHLILVWRLLVVSACESLHVCTVCVWCCEHARFCVAAFMCPIEIFIHSFVHSHLMHECNGWWLRKWRVDLIIWFSGLAHGVGNLRLVGGHVATHWARPLRGGGWEACVAVVHGAAGEADGGVSAVPRREHAGRRLLHLPAGEQRTGAWGVWGSNLSVFTLSRAVYIVAWAEASWVTFVLLIVIWELQRQQI